MVRGEDRDGVKNETRYPRTLNGVRPTVYHDFGEVAKVPLARIPSETQPPVPEIGLAETAISGAAEKIIWLWWRVLCSSPDRRA